MGENHGVLRRKIVTFLLAAAWLGIIAVSVYIAVTRREKYGYFAYTVPTMAVFMLVLFVLAFLPKSQSESRPSQWLGKLATGALILIVIGVLIAAAFNHRGSVVGFAVMILFLVTFVQIFISWLKEGLHCTKRPRRRFGSSAGSENRALKRNAAAHLDENNKKNI